MECPKLGDTVKDTISGFSGVVTSRTEFLNGCIRVGISPSKLDKDGKVIPTEVFDQEQVEVTKRAKQAKIPDEDKTTGGDRDTPISRPKH